jgi:hypothetical protein
MASSTPWARAWEWGVNTVSNISHAEKKCFFNFIGYPDLFFVKVNQRKRHPFGAVQYWCSLFAMAMPEKKI